ncbi:hypothetical protein [Curtobacterium sp. MCPF17_046]|uniref:hypothetical protein n=1 Tax=Curtobacterium sp. MCPF17_046 TaxID=2175663 RepID=UPI001C645A7F|nr:hypothetical protein [Curtobacterium sp. MCPF17_046]
MNPTDVFAQFPAALLQGLIHAFADLIAAIGQLWTQHPVIGTAFGLLVLAGIVMPRRKRHRRSW